MRHDTEYILIMLFSLLEDGTLKNIKYDIQNTIPKNKREEKIFKQLTSLINNELNI